MATRARIDPKVKAVVENLIVALEESIIEEDVVDDENAVDMADLPPHGTSVTVTKTKEVKDTKVYKTYEDFDYGDLKKYAGLDCIATSEILTRLFAEMREVPTLLVPKQNHSSPVPIKGPPVIKQYLDIIAPCHEFILDMEINGMKYDIEKNYSINLRMEAEVLDLEDKIFSAIGKRINLNSSIEVGEYLYGEKNFVAPFQTKSGEDALDGNALMTMAGLNPLGGIYVTEDPSLQFLAYMAKRKDIDAVNNTFVKNYVRDFVKKDGRIHPSYNLHGTSSFRITGGDPNLTQLPRPKHGYNIRECFIVEDEYVFLTWDFSSAEVKVLGAICKDKNMLKAIADGLDFHSFSASAMYGIPYDEFVHHLEDKSSPKRSEYKNMRQIAKVLTFSLLYGSSVGGIAFQLGISTSESQRLMDLYFKAYPGVKTYIDESHRMAKWNQKVWTPFGQYKNLYSAQDVFRRTAAYNAALRNAQNVRIQSATSTMGLITFSKMNEALKPLGAKAICTVYDSIEFEVPRSRAAEALEIGFSYMDEWPVKTFDWLNLPVGSDAEIGINWGTLESVKRGTMQAELDAIIDKMRAKEAA